MTTKTATYKVHDVGNEFYRVIDITQFAECHSATGEISLAVPLSALPVELFSPMAIEYLIDAHGKETTDKITANCYEAMEKVLTAAWVTNMIMNATLRD